jgi:uncharacterized protein
MTRRQGLVAAVAALAVLVVAGRAAAATWADWQWFDALGAGEVWRATQVEQLLLRLAAFVAGSAFAAANIAGVRQSILLLVLPRRLGNLEIGEQVSARTLNVAVAGVALLLGAGFAWFAPVDVPVPFGPWVTPFGETDPYFDRDLSFFVLRLPFEAAWYEWSVVVSAGVGVAVVVLYALTPALRWHAGQLRMSGWVRRHLTVLGAVVLALLAWGLRLDTYALPIEGNGPDGLFTAVDHRVLVPANFVLSLATVVMSLLVLWAGWSGQLRVAFGGVSAVLAGALLVRGVLPVAGDRLMGADDPAARNAPYRETRLSYTRRAFAVDLMRGTLNVPLPTTTAAAIGSLPLWDQGALAAVLERSRPGTRVVGDAAWWSGGGYSAALVVGPSAPGAVSSWAVVSTDPRQDPDGTGVPAFAEQPVPPVLVHDAAEGVLVAPNPGGTLAAPGFGSLTSRVLHAWALQRPQLLAAGASEASVLVLTRDVRERVARLAGGFLQGATVVPLVAGDSLWWSVELYSASASYPLARRVAVRGGDVRYYRHAATALVHAASGRVRLAVRHDADPLARTLLARLPGLTVRRDQLPPALGAALPVPVDGARAQAVAASMTGTREAPLAAARRVPVVDGADTLVSGGSPALWRLADGTAAWSTPVVNSADSVVAVVMATGGVQPVTRQVPVVHGPSWSEALERLAAAGDGRRDDVRRVAGRVRVIPRADSGVVLLQPRYAWPVAGAPSLDGLVAWSDGTVREGRTVAAVGGPSAVVATDPPVDTAARQRLAPLYDRLRAALARGDFAEFGRLLDALGRALGRVPERVREP